MGLLVFHTAQSSTDLDPSAGGVISSSVISRPSLIDHTWDEFLASTRLGQFQQSSRWAEFKTAESWHCERVILRDSGYIVGGFQVLWRQTRWGRMGFLYKGPVAGVEDAGLVSELQLRVRQCARQLGLRILILQAPDDSTVSAASFERLGFIADNPTRVMEATYLVNVREGMDAVRSRMSSSVRKHLRKAVRTGVVVREGTAADLPEFFALMRATCQRQGTRPNPGSVASLRQLWNLFAPGDTIRLTFASKDDVTIAGQLSLRFGRRVSLWKKGWDGSNGNWHANELLEDESLAWAHRVGAETCDFCSMDPGTARAILTGTTAPNVSSRDAFNLRFGGTPKILPRVMILIPNPALRWAYRQFSLGVLRWRTRPISRARAQSSEPPYPGARHPVG